MNRIIVFSILASVVVLLDVYCYLGLRSLIASWDPRLRRAFVVLFWTFNAVAYIGFIGALSGLPLKGISRWIFLVTFTSFISKLFLSLFLVVDDVRRGLLWVWSALQGPASGGQGSPISRSSFLQGTALVMGSLPVAGVTYGVALGAHDYRVKRVKVPIANLPEAWQGTTIVQISDIHSGSLWSRRGIRRGIRMVMDQNADLVFFTGDLVNDVYTEMTPWLDEFKEISAPLGVYSTMGNHDYGDYAGLKGEARQQHLNAMYDHHAYMGWDLLNNEHRVLERDGHQLAIVGVENWGRGRFSKYGNLPKALEGLDGQAAAHILLSHDPSHWEAEALAASPRIDLTLSGHTHGMQFGVEIPGLKWSPVQYMYKQWAGLYEENSQHLYVNRGFGYIGFPGRIGMPPEVTVLELTNA